MITFESLDVGSLFSDIPYMSREYGSSSYMNVIGSRCSFAGGYALDSNAFLFNEEVSLLLSDSFIITSKPFQTIQTISFV